MSTGHANVGVHVAGTGMDNRAMERIASGSLLLIRLGVGGILIWSGISKIHRPFDFLTVVYRYELVGARAGVLIAIVLPWLEVLVGVCLVGGLLVSGAMLLSIVLAGIFALANVYAIYNGLHISCGCFGGEGDSVGYVTLARACALLVAGGLGYAMNLRKSKRSM